MPKYSYIKINNYQNKSFTSIYKNLKILKYFLLEQYLPDLFGRFIDKFFVNILSRKYVFLRCPCDHFGPWIFVFLYINSTEYDPKKKYFVIAKKDSIDSYWINYFRKENLHIVYNPILIRLIAPLFFSTYNAIDINGYNYISFYKNNKTYRNFKKMPAISDSFMKSLSINLTNQKSFKEEIFSRKLVIFSPRFGTWKHSIKNSKRNMSVKAAKKILKVLVQKYNVFIVDKYELTDLGKHVFTIEDLKGTSISLSDIYMNSFFVIGSVSGGSQFPSLVFNKPTLYIADIPPHHLKSYYLMPRGKYVNKPLISKDIWLMISNNDFEELPDNKYHEILDEILLKSNRPRKLEGFKTYICDSSSDDEEPLFEENNNGNIIIYNSKDFAKKFQIKDHNE